MPTDYDLVVIGAGPAGIAAATMAARSGLATAILDEQPEPGGQIYRAVETVAAQHTARLVQLGPDYGRGADLVARLRQAQVDYLPGATVWNVGRDRVVNYSRAGRSGELHARHVLVATGALERPVPIPGWTLPGVMTVGALQILFKTAGIVPEGEVVLAGSGPLLLLLAVQYLRAGVKPAAVVETVPPGRLRQAARYLPGALRASGYLAKGLGFLGTLRRAGIVHYRGASRLAVEGSDHATALAFHSGGREQRVAAATVALHEGLIPNQQITRLLGCDHFWDETQRCFRPRLDDWFMTTVDGVSVAGDGGGIGGAKAAELRGRIAALAISHRLGKLSGEERDRQAAPERSRLAKDLAVRPFLEALYAPPAEVVQPADEVLVCRCEEVTAGQVREAVRLGCPGPNQAKSFLRCGMGPCQGRYCGPTVTEIIAAERGIGVAESGYYRIRPPLKPLNLGELATLDQAGGTEAA